MITSLQNPTIKDLMKLSQKKTRDKEGTFLVEGEHLVEEAIKANRIKRLIKSEDYKGIIDFKETLNVSTTVAKKLSNTSSSSSIFGECFIQTKRELRGTRFLLGDQIQDPGNLGTMIRSAYSFGFDGVIVSKDSADFYNDKCVRSSQGALFHLATMRMDLSEAMAELKSQGVLVIGTDIDGSQDFEEIENQKIAILVGNEGQGVSESLLSLTDVNVKIETVAFESLNVGVAAGILLYHFRKR